jgi:CheY-like chemotaxis protein
VIRRTLEKQGWSVAEAENGRAALDRVRRQPPSLVLLDLMMPEMDGFEFLSTFRKEAAWDSIPVVVLTAKDLTPEERAMLSGNVERVLQKGAYTREVLLREVKKIVTQCTAAPAARRRRRRPAGRAAGPGMDGVAKDGDDAAPAGDGAAVPVVAVPVAAPQPGAEPAADSQSR